MVYTDAIKQQEAMMIMTKKQAQLLLLAAGVLMLLFGLWRGEADTVFSKAIRLCMECVGDLKIISGLHKSPAKCKKHLAGDFFCTFVRKKARFMSNLYKTNRQHTKILAEYYTKDLAFPVRNR